MAFDGIDPFARPRTIWDCLISGGIPTNATAAELQWLAREHERRSRYQQRDGEISPAAHLNEAARCRHAMRRIA